MQSPGARLPAPPALPPGGWGSRGAGPAPDPRGGAGPGGVSGAAPPPGSAPRSGRASRGAGMHAAAATPRRRARPGAPAVDAEPAPANGTGERRGCGPREGLCTHFADRDAEGRAAQLGREGVRPAVGWERAAGSGGARPRRGGPQPGSRRTESLSEPSLPPGRRPSGAEARLQAPRNQAAAASRPPAQVRASPAAAPAPPSPCSLRGARGRGPALRRGAPLSRLAPTPTSQVGKLSLAGERTALRGLRKRGGWHLAYFVIDFENV